MSIVNHDLKSFDTTSYCLLVYKENGEMSSLDYSSGHRLMVVESVRIKNSQRNSQFQCSFSSIRTRKDDRSRTYQIFVLIFRLFFSTRSLSEDSLAKQFLQFKVKAKKSVSIFHLTNFLKNIFFLTYFS